MATLINVVGKAWSESLWERACSRRRSDRQQLYRMCRPLREQARSHKGNAVHGCLHATPYHSG
ncbi:hypothetical protein C0J56_02775 [Pseudomonas fluorescens]|nr:hypothetical protein C0J56_02775 [Pseudomonas fluorescens]